MAVVRHLSTSSYGAYSTILSFLTIGMIVAEFGLSQVLVREIAQQKDRNSELFSGAILVAVPLVAIVSCGTILVAIVIGYSPAFYILLAFSTIAIFTNTLVLLAGAVLRAFERMGVLSLINSVVLSSSAVAGIFWLQHGAGLRELIVLFAITSTVNALSLMIYVLKRLASFVSTRAFIAAKGLLIAALPIGIFLLCGVILRRFSVLVLSSACGMSQAGIYDAARTFTNALAMITQSVIGAVFPFMAILWKQSAMATVRSYEQMLRFFAIAGMAATVGVFLLANKIVLLLYGEAYLESATCLRILIWAFMLNAFSGPVGMLLIVTQDRLRHYIPYALVATALSIMGNILLTPKHGYIAASWIAVFTALLLYIFKLIALKDILPVRPKVFKISWRSVVASGLMGGNLWLSRELPLAPLIVIGFVTYTVALIALGEFKWEYYMLYRHIGKGLKT
jgi:O-antigen/teichoic acid export membrane protein